MATQLKNLNRMGHFYRPLSSITTKTDLKHWSLKNGSRCVMAPIPGAKLTCLDLWCSAGSANEQIGEEGLAHFLEHMVFKGSNRLEPGQFDHQIEALGGSSNAATGFDDVHFYVLVPPRSVNAALELLLDLVLNPTLQTDAFSLEREVVLEEIAQYQDQPDEQIIQYLLHGCWGGHPYGRPILGLEESLKASNPTAMRAFHNRQYRGPNCCLSIAGALPEGLHTMIANSQLADIEKNSSKDFAISKKPILNFVSGRCEIHVPRLESARLLMTWPIPPASNQEMIMGADLATTLLSEGRRSRFIQRLREDLQIVETVDMDVTVLEQGSLVTLEACCLEKNVDQVEEEIHKLLKASIMSSPSNKEIERTCQLVRNGLCFSLEAPSQVAGMAGSHTLWNRPQSLLEPLNHIDSWTATRLQDEIFRKFQPELSYTLIARPQEAIR